ncbi:MAG TPA: Clp protease N-terminal domain-containing protein [Gemmatimonadaceae bacterium]|nr:Clp protease N-terminal domain-containing protein [Gemmatimonadaceae bacterium]
MAESYDFTTDIRRVLRRARENALEHGDHAVEPVHLLYGLTALTTSRGTATLIALGADLRDLQLLAGGPVENESAAAAPTRRSMIARLLRRPSPVVAPPADIPYSPRTNRVLQLTLAEFQRRGDPDCDTDHLLLGMLALNDDRATALLASAGVDLDRARTAVARLRSARS